MAHFLELEDSAVAGRAGLAAAAAPAESAEIIPYTSGFRRFLSAAIFPVTMSAFLAYGVVAMNHGLRPEFLSPTAVPVFIVLIVLLERFHPYCRSWSKGHDDVRTDFLHLLFSSLLTTQVLNWILLMTLVGPGARLASTFHWFHWPTSWPILIQLAFGLVISEFGGYWAHRLQHKNDTLWRLHAVHHGAPRLYWLNAARFHPLDMAMLVVGGFAPLILLGCPPKTLALTVLFAGMHGTFQHANIGVKLGPLNWVFSMAELHRWHHSTSIEESNANYSGHVLIWDIVFGTRFLPKDRLPPHEIGILDMPEFPTTYLEHLKSPFKMEEIRARGEAKQAQASRSSTAEAAALTHTCSICGTVTKGPVEEAKPRSNVRRFSTEHFTVWRCPKCKSIHAADDVDLDYYYRGYPFHGSTELDFAQIAVYRNMARRLSRAGVTKEHTILDYGCGSGALVKYLRSVGYSRAEGYDQFSPEFHRPELLEQKFDCIVSQDVIEHVLDPDELLRTFDRLANPGCVIAIGTPNAEAIDLNDTEYWVHALHQPYHRHLYAVSELKVAGEPLGWELAHYYPTEYVNTLVPFVNLRFVIFYLQCFGNMMDVAFEPKRVDNWKLWTPLALYFGLFGYFHATDSGVMVVFRKRG